MELGDIIVEGGLINQRWKDQQELKSARDAQNLERKLRARQIASEEGLIDMQHQKKKGALQSDIDDQEFDASQRGVLESGEARKNRHQYAVEGLQQPVEQMQAQADLENTPLKLSMEKADLEGEALTRESMREVEKINAELQLAATELKKANQALLLDTAGQGMQAQNREAQAALDDIKLKQVVLLYKKLKIAGPQAILNDINNNDLLFGKVQYQDIYMMNSAGERVKNAEKASHIILMQPDGKELSVPVSELKGMADSIGKTTVTAKPGDTTYTYGAGGDLIGESTAPFKPFDPKGYEYKDGIVLNKDTGVVHGTNGEVGQFIVSANDKALDDRVSKAMRNHVFPLYGGKYEGGIFYPDPEKADEGSMVGLQMARLIRQGVQPEEAAIQALNYAKTQTEIQSKVGEGSVKGRSVIDGMGGANWGGN